MIDPAPSRSTVKGLPSRSPSRRASPSSSTKIRSPTLSPGLTISPSRNRTRVRLCSRRRRPSMVRVLKGAIVAIASGDPCREAVMPVGGRLTADPLPHRPIRRKVRGPCDCPYPYQSSPSVAIQAAPPTTIVQFEAEPATGRVGWCAAAPPGPDGPAAGARGPPRLGWSAPDPENNRPPVRRSRPPPRRCGGRAPGPGRHPQRGAGCRSLGRAGSCGPGSAARRGGRSALRSGD